jgi:hypothetical protein
VYDPSQLGTSNDQGSTSNWQTWVNAGTNLTTSFVNAFTSGGQTQCPSGYVNIGGGKCAKYAQPGSSAGGMALAVGALGIAFLLLRK